METVLRLPRLLGIRIQSSPLLISLAALPMLVILALVAVLVWVSFQTGIIGTPDTAELHAQQLRTSFR